MEIKYVFPGSVLNDVRQRVRLHPFGFIQAYPLRQVNSLYFDTPELEALQLNEAGVSDRVKVRVRWYGETRHMVDPVLEIKEKFGLAGRKLQHPLEKNFALPNIRWRVVTQSIAKSLPPSMIGYINFTYMPSLLNNYQREYYTDRTGTIRVTIDYTIKSYDQRCTAKANLHRETLKPDLTVVEFKAPIAEEQILRRATSSFGWRISRNSKYVRGLLPDNLY